MAPKWLLGIRGQVPRPAGILLGLVPIIVLMALWTWATWGMIEERWISPTILPSPMEVVGSIPRLLTVSIDEAGFFHHIWTSLWRVGLGYLLALAIVLPLGIAMGAFGSIRSTFAPMTTASGYIPIATLLPLTMAWFGTQEKQKVIFLALAFGIYLLPMVVRAIDAVPDVYLRTAYTLGATRWQAVFRVLLPVALPDLWHGMRLAFGVGWTYLVLAEVVVLSGGLGHVIQIAQRRGPREHIYLVIVVITLIAWAADLIWERLGRVLFPYRRSHK